MRMEHGMPFLEVDLRFLVMVVVLRSQPMMGMETVMSVGTTRMEYQIQLDPHGESEQILMLLVLTCISRLQLLPLMVVL